MIKLKDILKEATSPVKIGSAFPGMKGRKNEIEIVVGKGFGKWKIVYFNMVRKYVSGVGYSPDSLMNYDDIFKLSSSFNVGITIESIILLIFIYYIKHIKY